MTGIRAHLLPHRSAALIFFVLALSTPAIRTPLAAKAEQRTYPTADEAVQAFIISLRAGDPKAVEDVLGASAEPLISSGDKVADRRARENFLRSYDEAHSLTQENDNRTILQVGKDQWPFPIPLVKTDGGHWRFDTAAGKEEILNRRIGANELSTIQSCLAYVDAQREYYSRNPEKDRLLHYAQRLSSTPGKRDGLYWEARAGEAESPLGHAFASARAEGYAVGSGKGDPYHGYYYRILTAQGPAAEGGAYDYVAHGKMLGGFALIAYPAKWGNSGVMTFIVNQDGVVFQKDLGPNTTAPARSIKTFNPDDTWKKVEPSAAAGAG